MPHPSIPDAWRYHSRSDSQLTLITGKKFDPAPLEDAIKASSPLIEDVVIFGNGKPYAGALLFRSQDASSKSDDEVLAGLLSYREIKQRKPEPCKNIAKHAYSHDVPRERVAEKQQRYSYWYSSREAVCTRIKYAYSLRLPVEDFKILDAEIPQAIHEIVTSVVGNANAELLTDDTDLFSYGADSVACIQIRHALTRLVPGRQPTG